MDFGSVLGAKLEPCWPPFFPSRASMTPPGRPQKAPRRPQDTPRRPKTPQDPRKTPPGRPQGAQNHPRRRFWDNFKEILDEFQVIGNESRADLIQPLLSLFALCGSTEYSRFCCKHGSEVSCLTGRRHQAVRLFQ